MTPNIHDDIYFNPSSRDQNDEYNKKREYIICKVINNQIPQHFYERDFWKNLRIQTNKFIQNLCVKNKIHHFKEVTCSSAGGRNKKYDFEIKIDNESYYVEWKFNCERVTDAPQFSSPMKPSQYLDISFESYFYDNHLQEIAKAGNFSKPEKNIYLNTIHAINVKCLESYKNLYKTNEVFKKKCKSVDKKAIKNFILKSDVKLKILSKYLKESQKNKFYMLYKNGKINLETINEDIFELTRVVEKKPTSYICETKTGMKVAILLRFKNGCGLQYPALQISRKIPNVKELRNLCETNNIKEVPKLKRDILKVLDDNNIIY